MSTAAVAQVSEDALIAAFEALRGVTPGEVRLCRDEGGLYFLATTAHCDPLIGPADAGEVLREIRRWRNRLTNERHLRIGGASPIKSRRRGRPRDREVERRRDALVDIVRAAQPATVRQVFYLAETLGLVPKSDEGYRRVQNDLVLLRREARIPYGWITDGTRWQRKPGTFDGIAEALQTTAEGYRKSLWRNADAYVEIWCEKDALSGVIYPVTSLYDVPLMVARGYSSITFLHSAGQYIAQLDVPAYIYHLGDYDPSGQDAARAIEQSLREFAPEAEIHFERLAVTPVQIAEWHLPTRPTKTTDTRAKKFAADHSVELDAIEPDRLRELVQDAILQHLDLDELEVLRAAEASERELLLSIAGSCGGAA